MKAVAVGSFYTIEESDYKRNESGFVMENKPNGLRKGVITSIGNGASYPNDEGLKVGDVVYFSCSGNCSINGEFVINENDIRCKEKEE